MPLFHLMVAASIVAVLILTLVFRNTTSATAAIVTFLLFLAAMVPAVWCYLIVFVPDDSWMVTNLQEAVIYGRGGNKDLSLIWWAENLVLLGCTILFLWAVKTRFLSTTGEEHAFGEEFAEALAQSATSTTCERCGTPNDEGAMFCQTCGKDLRIDPPEIEV